MRDHWRVSVALWVAVMGALAPAGPARAGPDPQALLVQADEVRNPERDFAATMTLTEYRGGRQETTVELVVFSKLAPGTGQYNNIVRYLSPKRDAGKLILRNGVDLWFYDPASKASVRLSPQARLLGQASTGDVMSTNLAKAYRAEAVGTEQIEDDARKVRTCVRLRLVAARQDVPYARVEYWVEEGTGRPIKAQFFTAEARLLKTAFFRRYLPILGRERPTETVIVDGLDPKWVTILRETDVRWRELPDAWLQRDYLPHFRGDE